METRYFDGLEEYRAIKRLLKKYKYPPEECEGAIEVVMAQCELWADTKIYE